MRLERLLLTGFPGWLTTRVLDDLLARPPEGLREVVCLSEPGAELALPARPAIPVRVIRGTLDDGRALAAAVAGCAGVLHAAGVLHVRRTSDWYRVNTEGTRGLLAAALRTGGLRRFVLVSSNAAAGRAPRAGILLREDMVARPLSHYGRSKRLAEEIVLRERAAAEIVVLRPCMFYGPPVPPRHVEVYRRIQSGRMPLVGGGNFDRSVTHIGNLVDACRLALWHPRAAGEIFHIADRHPCTTLAVVQAMAAALEVKPRFLHLPPAVARCAHALDRLLAAAEVYVQPLHLLGEADWHVGVSVEKAVSLLGYDPKVDLRDGMRSAVEWCRARGLLD